MATTTNFGWETPDDTDLVKDGALAMRTLGNAIDASLVDLKGGTTGQVLSKNSNTDMDFTWVTSDDADAIQNSIVDAKGDLIAATAADTPARLAVGANGKVLGANSSTATGLEWVDNYGPAFRAGRTGSTQTFSANTFTKVQLNTEDFDTDNCFDNTTNYRFTANKAGYYQFTANALVSGANGAEYALQIRRNGTSVNLGYNANIGGMTYMGGTAATLLYLNGTTDYVELWVYVASGSPFVYNSPDLATAALQGVWIRG